MSKSGSLARLSNHWASPVAEAAVGESERDEDEDVDAKDSTGGRVYSYSGLSHSSNGDGGFL
jgi:hypothetical protein